MIARLSEARKANDERTTVVETAIQTPFDLSANLIPPEPPLHLAQTSERICRTNGDGAAFECLQELGRFSNSSKRLMRTARPSPTPKHGPTGPANASLIRAMPPGSR